MKLKCVMTFFFQNEKRLEFIFIEKSQCVTILIDTEKCCAHSLLIFPDMGNWSDLSVFHNKPPVPLSRLISRPAHNVKLVRYWLLLYGSIRKLVLARHFPFQFYAREHFYHTLFATRATFRRRKVSTLSYNEVLSLSALSRARR